MKHGRILGIDPGERRVGVALSDPEGVIASPHSIVAARVAVELIAKIADENDVRAIVVGLPLTLGGDEGAAANAARRLGAQIAEATGRNLVYWDERFTSVQAERALVAGGMKRKDRRATTDKVAAALLLQSYLDAQMNDRP